MSAAPTLPNLRDFSRVELAAFVAEAGLPKYRADQLFRWIHEKKAAAFDEMSDLPKEMRQALPAIAALRGVALDLEQLSKDGTRKFRLKTADDRKIETVLIPFSDASATEADDGDAGENLVAPEPEHMQHALFPRRPKLTQCISSQVGCALDCRFCATAELGFGRQLTTGEIVDQVYFADRFLAALPADDPTKRAGSAQVSNIVFMGMGEPLHNYDNVVRALHILTDQRGANFGKRRITVSTAGLVPGIEKLATESLQVNLAVSLNATTDEVRDEIMPINRKWNIARLLEAVRKIPLDRRRRVTFEYVMLAGVNDSPADAARLGKLLRGIPSKVNVIPWNPHDEAKARFSRPSDAHIELFQQLIRAEGLAVYYRKSRGVDIDAACGQLAGRNEEHLVPVEMMNRKRPRSAA